MKLILNNKRRHVEVIMAATTQFQEICGAFFREKRIQQNKTEQEVADDLNVSVETIQAYECGKEGIPLCHVDAISELLKIPQTEIMELHLDLEKKILPKPLFEQHFIKDQNVGKIIRQSRKTVYLSEEAVAQLLSRSGYVISKDEIMDLERGIKDATVEFWSSFCALIHLPTDSVKGYSRWEHLAQVSFALSNNKIRIPVGSKLLNSLENYRAACGVNAYKVSYLMRFSIAFRRKWLR